MVTYPARWAAASFQLALLGATLGVALDAVHTHTGTTVYPHPSFFQMAWWVPPLFASAAVAMGLGRPLVERLLGRVTPVGSPAAVVVGMALFVVAYVLSGVLTGSSGTRSLVLAAVFGVAWTLCDRSALGVALAAATALVGTLVEHALVRAGAFAYLHPDLGGVAGWLPLLYATGAIGVGHLGKRLVDGTRTAQAACTLTAPGLSS